MSIDIPSIIMELSFLIQGIVLFFLFSRAVIIGRKFVNQVYRSRVFWFAGVMLVALILVLSVLIQGLFGFNHSIPLTFFGISVLSALILVLFVYADRTILVTLEMDFLHRNTLHWRSVRKLAYAAIFPNVFYITVAAFITVLPGVPPWVSALFPSILVREAILAIFVTLGYSFTAVIIGARRTSDLTMKRHVRWLGLSFLIFLVLFVLIALATTWSGLLADFTTLVSLYTFYRALMSLTFIGRLEVETK